MGHTALILGDQLMRDHPALDGASRVVFVESTKGMARLRTHRRRVHLVLVAMRRFAAELRDAGEVEVVERRGAASLAEGLEGLSDVAAAAPNSLGGRRALRRLGVSLVPSKQFLVREDAFAAWAAGRRRIVMEDFYREQRRAFGVLVDGDAPVEGRWNFDRENRRPPRAGLETPEPWWPEEDAVDEEVRADLERLPLELWGQDGPRQWASSPDEARAALDAFVRDRLPGFGPYQDAMVPGERWMWHALLSAPLNLGILSPLSVVRAAEAAYRAGDAPIASVEGFVRQVLGWREFIHGMYWLRAEQWPDRNALDATMDLPEAFWGQRTGWNCLDTVVEGVEQDGYAHHIQRLMVLGNIALTAGVEPWQAVRWFQSAFIDGAEWVMAPNAAGMSLYADGGEMTTKPYASGGNYIDKMSGYCKGCRYSPRVRTGPEACPVTALYWDFTARHRERLAENRRVRFALRTLDKMAPEELAAVRERADRARAELRDGAAEPSLEA